MSTESSAIEVLRQAHERTLAAGSARILLCVAQSWPMPPMPQRRRGGLLRPVLKLGMFAGKRVWTLVTRDFDFGHREAEGVLDISGRRYMLDYGSYARLYADHREWDGRSGRSLSTLPPSCDQTPTPLWLLDLLAGITDVSDQGSDSVRGTSCRHLVAKTDLSRASPATPDGIVPPRVSRFEDLLALPVDAWVDDQHIRRLRLKTESPPEVRTETLDLWDHGTRLDGLDWTRLPTFRSPEEAADLAARDR